MGLSKVDQSLSRSDDTLPVMEFIYRNYKGEVSNRRILDPQKPYYGETEYHKGLQWIMKAYDIDKQDFRDFALKDILTYI